MENKRHLIEKSVQLPIILGYKESIMAKHLWLNGQKVIKRPSEEAWVWIDSVLIKREAQALLI